MKIKYKISYFLLLLFITTNHCFAQAWTEPVNVSNQNGFIVTNDFTIDNSGVFHCVWRFKHNSNFSVIYYSSSEDDGITWTTPVIISQNDTNSCVNPQITHDSENTIFVGYDLYGFDPENGVWATLLIKKNGEWTEPYKVSPGMTTRLAVDNNNRLYVFWYEGAPHNGEFHYKYLEDTIWSEAFCPYDNDELTAIYNVVVDEDNNLHCAGFHDSTGYLDLHAMYLKYDYENDEWGEMHDFIEKVNVRTVDITLDTLYQPHMAWGGNMVFYSYLNNNTWSETDTVTQKSPSVVDIECNEYNGSHITVIITISGKPVLCCFDNTIENNWGKYLIDSSDNFIRTPCLQIFNDKQYLCYDKSDEAPISNIFLSSFDIQTSIFNNRQNNNSLITGLNIFPNPFSNYLNIHFIINELSYVKIDIYDLQGKHIENILESEMEKQQHIIQWDGTNYSNTPVNNGVYLCVIKTNTNIIEKKIVLMK